MQPKRPKREETRGEVFPEWSCDPGALGQVVSDKVPDKGSDCNRQLDRAGTQAVADVRQHRREEPMLLGLLWTLVVPWTCEWGNHGRSSVSSQPPQITRRSTQGRILEII